MVQLLLPVMQASFQKAILYSMREYDNVIMHRVFGILYRAGAYPDVPAELEGMERTIAKKDQLIEAKDRQLVKAAKTLAKALSISIEEAEKLLS